MFLCTYIISCIVSNGVKGKAGDAQYLKGAGTQLETILYELIHGKIKIRNPLLFCEGGDGERAGDHLLSNCTIQTRTASFIAPPKRLFMFISIYKLHSVSSMSQVKCPTSLKLRKLAETRMKFL